jgi:hypothetical protein
VVRWWSESLKQNKINRDRDCGHDLKHGLQFPHLIAVGVYGVVIADASMAKAGAPN